MPSKIFLMSGHTSSGNLKKLDKRAVSEAENKNVLVLHMSSDDSKKLAVKKKFFNEYFRKAGAEQVDFLERDDTRNPEEYFQKAGLLYLPGENTKTLIGNIKQKGLDLFISSFPGIISGNSAGAYALCPDYIKLREDSIEIVPAMGIVDFWVKAHYDPKNEFFNSTLSILSQQGKEIYGLQDPAAIIVSKEGAKREIIGNVWRFSKGKRERMG